MKLMRSGLVTAITTAEMDDEGLDELHHALEHIEEMVPLHVRDQAEAFHDEIEMNQMTDPHSKRAMISANRIAAMFIIVNTQVQENHCPHLRPDNPQMIFLPLGPPFPTAMCHECWHWYIVEIQDTPEGHVCDHCGEVGRRIAPRGCQIGMTTAIAYLCDECVPMWDGVFVEHKIEGPDDQEAP